MKIQTCCLLMLTWLAFNLYSQKRIMEIDDLWRFQTIEDMKISPDGEWIVLAVRQYQNDEPNVDLYLITSRGGSARKLTTCSGYDGNPQWSPDGSLLAFISDRSGRCQIHILPMDGGEAHPFTTISGNVTDFLWSPDGDYFAFTTQILNDSQTSSDTLQPEEKARCYDHLLYRSQKTWQNNIRTHLFLIPVSGGDAWDLTPGDYDAPTNRLKSSRDFAFSPDGKEIAFVRNIDSVQTLSTNNDIYIISSKGGTLRRISQNSGNDNHPVYSPDGKYLAYRSARRSGNISDQYDLIIFDRMSNRTRNLTAGFDLDIEEIVWGTTSDHIFFTASDQGRMVIFSIDIKNEKIKGLLHTGFNTHLAVSPQELQLYFVRSQVDLPTEVFTCTDKGEELHELSFLNHALTNQIEINKMEDFWFPSFDGKLIHGFLIKPSYFDPAKTYPAILLIHEGFDTSWHDQFQMPWNAQLFVSQGFVVIMINPRGSKGYGQAFCDAASKNWGGTPYRDLMQGLDYAIHQNKFINDRRIAAAGSGFGGYMVNWMAGHTDRFSCLVSHAGLFDLVSFYGTTDDLYFPEWEFEGSPYENSRQYDRWSLFKFVKDFQTPTLVTHGALDYHIPANQGLQMFTALQRTKTPSKLLIFPDEGHVIESPSNIRLWWLTVFDWLKTYTKKGTP